MESDNVRVTLRIPEVLHAKAVELAKGADRSLNGQIVYLIRLGAGMAHGHTALQKKVGSTA